MDIASWLQVLGLSEYAVAFAAQAIDVQALPGLTDADLKELGVAKLGHRKKLLQAIAELPVRAQPATSPLGGCAASWPFAVAMPLHHYLDDTDPRLRLHAACDTVELLLRFLVFTAVADRRRLGDLDDRTAKVLWEHIETPTLGAWLAMARSLAGAKVSGELVVPEVADYVEGLLVPLLYGPTAPGTPETSLLRVRNQLAHGGGVTRKQAERLLARWSEPFESTMLAAEWLSDLSVLGRGAGGALVLLNGVQPSVSTVDPTLLAESEHGDAVWLLRGNRCLTLWPLAVFGKPSDTQAGRTGEEDAAQVYTRRDAVRLQYTPLGVEDFSQSEMGGSALEAFRRLFHFDKAEALRQEKGFTVRGFDKEIRRDARQMLGRRSELDQLGRTVRERRDGGVLWLTGVAGMGKSLLLARLATDLMDEHAEDDTLVLAYRFKAGDDARCRREALADYVEERLAAAGALLPGERSGSRKAEGRLEACLGRIRLDRHVLILLDGLDEIAQRDPEFAEAAPLKLRFPRLLWVCAGRPQPALMASMRAFQAEMPFPDGLPPMRAQDIRGMLMDRIGPLQKKLLAQDRERGDEVINPFVDLVTRRAAGLPLFVRYVVADVLAGRYRVLDGHEDLPASLHAYHEELLKRLGVGDLQSVVTPLVATLAVAREPLAAHEIAALLRLRKLVPDGALGGAAVRGADAGLRGGQRALRRGRDPERVPATLRGPGERDGKAAGSGQARAE